MCGGANPLSESILDFKMGEGLSVGELVKLTLSTLRRAEFYSASRVEILKTAYLLEREYYLREGKRLSSLPYYHYPYGPFNGLIIEAVEELSLPKLDDNIYEIYGLDDETLGDVDYPEKALKRVLKILKKHSDEVSLVKYALRLKEVKKTPPGEEIDFSSLHK